MKPPIKKISVIAILQQYYYQCNFFTGENWEIISQHLKDRTDQQCQQRWTKVVNPNLIKGGCYFSVRSFYILCEQIIIIFFCLCGLFLIVFD